jgi:hypothetical protein
MCITVSSARIHQFIVIFSVLIGIIDKTAQAGRIALLRTFVRLQYQHQKSSNEGVHQSICHYIPILLRSGNIDADMTLALLRQLWFFVDVVIKSMAQHMLINDMHKV